MFYFFKKIQLKKKLFQISNFAELIKVIVQPCEGYQRERRVCYNTKILNHPTVQLLQTLTLLNS